jgi:alcohol dehydrogenase class IV
MEAFEFATAARIAFGCGVRREVAPAVAALGRRVLVVCGGDATRVAWLEEHLRSLGLDAVRLSVPGEPAVETVEEGVDLAQRERAQIVVAAGGGSVLDAGKAVAGLVGNPGSSNEYLEVVGLGRPLPGPGLPFIAVPTTAGTGTEVTRNAVLAVRSAGVKVSLRSPYLLPRAAFVDPELTLSMSPAVTAATGMDAACQVLEPFVSVGASAMTDPFCQEGLARVGRSLRRAFADGGDLGARSDMALASLFGGLALANARLGAVHGFAAPLGGRYGAPHGDLCARLVAPVWRANLRALREREPGSPSLGRYAQAARLLTGNAAATADDGAVFVEELSRDLGIRSLSAYGVSLAEADLVVQAAARASSMKGNPIVLTLQELRTILEEAL